MEKLMFKCDVCGVSYQHGPHKYEGHKLNLYGGLFVCHTCWQSNHDGWAPHHEKILLAHLKEKGLSVPQRNAKGFLPRE